MSRKAPTTFTDFQIVRPEDLPRGAVGYARRKIGRLSRYSREPFRHVRVRFDVTRNSGATELIGVRAELDVDGRRVRAHARAVTVREAVDALDHRLRRRLAQANPHWEARRGHVRPL